MERTCGTCALARPRGPGDETVCTHQHGHRFTVATERCRRPRQWWRPRPELMQTQAERPGARQMTFAL